MCMRYVGFVVLLWFAGVLHAQGAARPCKAPTLIGGYFVPKIDTYSHESKLTYACEDGRKPAVKGWWATSTCQNGTWSPAPQCIVKSACIPPEIPNGKPTESRNVWYENGQSIRTTCDKGYEQKDRIATAICRNGLWTSVPVCEKSINACSEPPLIPHAVIIHQGYQEVFAVDSELLYECEDGYSVEAADSRKSIVCIGGSWTEGPSCITRPFTGNGHSEVGGTAGGHTTSVGSETQPAGRETRPVSYCGQPPSILNGDIVETDQMLLKYQCNAYNKLVGPETVECYSDGTWSDLPTCRESYCTLNTTGHRTLKPVGVKFIKDGETVRFECLDLWTFTNYADVSCTDGKRTLTRCCNKVQLTTNTC